jgi:hypothetical protein
MKNAIAILATVFAVSAFAAEPAKAPAAATPAPAVTATPAPHKAEVKKEVKPAKSVPAKDEKAAAPAAKPASK